MASGKKWNCVESPHAKNLEVKLSDGKPDEAPDIYCDGVQIGLTPYDVMIELGRRPAGLPTPANAKPVCVGTIRMSLQHAKVLAIMLRKNLKNYEDATGPISMHPVLLEQLGISKEEDW
jgi:hypothetical protein